jgi:L-alanine-DL-glutamate epimerase-like enolase superfamily enzyme
MKITNITAHHFLIPLPTVLTDSRHGQMPHFELVICQIETDSGAGGLGYTYTVGAGAAAIHSLITRELTPQLIGADPRRIEQLWQQMWWQLHYVGRGGLVTFAIGALDIALWDLKARLADEPLWRFLGGCDPRVKVYAGGIDLQMPLDALCEQTARNLERGFRAIKMKAGRANLAEDIARVKAMREFIGPDVVLMTDANMAWSVEQAIRAARAFAEYDVYWLEEPTIPDDFDGNRRIEREGGLAVASGENLHTIYEFQKMIGEAGIAFPEPDISNLGGITPWLKVAHLAEAHNRPVTTHGVHDLHVHLLAAVPNASYLEAHGLGLEKYLKHPMQFADGYTLAPNRPGHGVVFDWEELAALKI